jgi:hypothetical protein
VHGIDALMQSDEEGSHADSSRHSRLGGDPDPLLSFLGSMVDAWGKGMTAWLPLARAAGESARHSSTAAGVTAAGVVPGLGKAWLLTVRSSLRYGGALADLSLRHQASLLRATGGADTPPSRHLVDELRAFLREVGDAASLEARRLQRELEEVGEGMARSTAPAPSQPASQDRRRHEVKP